MFYIRRRVILFHPIGLSKICFAHSCALTRREAQRRERANWDQTYNHPRNDDASILLYLKKKDVSFL